MAVENSDFPLAYFITWTTYATWLPGDDRGWVENNRGLRLPDRRRLMRAAIRLREDAVVLDSVQRDTVEQTIRDHCDHRGWSLFAVNCRSNHVHVVVGANKTPEQVAQELKAYCTRRLKKTSNTSRLRWWAEGSSTRYVNDERGLDVVVKYVLEAQDRKGRELPY